MTGRTLRRKLQKKLKRKPYRKCPKCGDRMRLKLIEGDHDGWHVLKYCSSGIGDRNNYCCSENFFCQLMASLDGKVRGCGHMEELFLNGEKETPQ